LLRTGEAGSTQDLGRRVLHPFGRRPRHGQL